MNFKLNSKYNIQNSKLRIIGLGNPLMGDDGAGIAAVERLASLPLPAGVEVVDGGTGGLTLLDLMPARSASSSSTPSPWGGRPARWSVSTPAR